MAPKTLTDFIGQRHLLDEGKILQSMINSGTIHSLVFFSEPGTGKTTLARLIAQATNHEYILFNAGSEDKASLTTKLKKTTKGSRPIIIIDEIHRLNRPKQDFLLQGLEEEQFYIIGTTTENPYFSLNHSLRSRLTILQLKPYSGKEIASYARKVAKFFHVNYQASEINSIMAIAGGDLRTVCNLLETSAAMDSANRKEYYQTFPHSHALKNSDYYDMVSALQKSIRGSDADAALLYLVALLENGHLDSVVRRLIVIAYEDIGFGNINLIARVSKVTSDALQLGMPEAYYPLSLLTIDLALAPKSRMVGLSFQNAIEA